MMNSVVLIAFENQAVVSTPTIGENDTLVGLRDMSFNHMDEFGFRTVGQGGTDDSSAPFEKTNNRDFPRCSAPPDATNPSWSEVAFIHFHTPSKRRRLGIGHFHNPPAEQAVKALGCILVNLGQTARFKRFHIGAEELPN